MGCGSSRPYAVNEAKVEAFELTQSFLKDHCTMQNDLFTRENELLHAMREYITMHSMTPLVHREFMTIRVAKDLVLKAAASHVLFRNGMIIGIRLDRWPVSSL